MLWRFNQREPLWELRRCTALYSFNAVLSAQVRTFYQICSIVASCQCKSEVNRESPYDCRANGQQPGDEGGRYDSPHPTCGRHNTSLVSWMFPLCEWATQTVFQTHICTKIRRKFALFYCDTLLHRQLRSVIIGALHLHKQALENCFLHANLN